MVNLVKSLLCRHPEKSAASVLWHRIRLFQHARFVLTAKRCGFHWALNYSVAAPPPTPEPASIMSLVRDSDDGIAVSPAVSLSPSPQPMARQQPNNITLNQLNFDIPTFSESCLVLGVLRAVSESFTNALRGNCSDLRRNARRCSNNPEKYRKLATAGRPVLSDPGLVPLQTGANHLISR